MDTLVEDESIVDLIYPTCPPSSPRPMTRQSSLRITTTATQPAPTFSFIPTPKTATPCPLKSPLSKPLPRAPPQWLWRCHLCDTYYPLGVTRRCLNDGHYFCAGTTINKRTGKRKTHSPCGSTFDYIGWQAYGDWRRHELDLRAKAARRATNTSAPQKPFRSEGPRTRIYTFFASNKEDISPTPTTLVPNCEQNCNFPSECRWKAKLTPDSPAPPKRKTLKTKKSIDSEVPSAPDSEATAVPAAKQEVKQEEPQPSKDFQLSKTSSRRQKSFSLPLSSYAWLVKLNDDAEVGGEILASKGVDSDSGTRTRGDEHAGEIGDGVADEGLWLVPVMRCEPT